MDEAVGEAEKKEERDDNDDDDDDDVCELVAVEDEAVDFDVCKDDHVNTGTVHDNVRIIAARRVEKKLNIG